MIGVKGRLEFNHTRARAILSTSPIAPPAAESWIRVKDAAAILGVETRMLYRWIASGRVTVRRLPHARPRLLRQEIEALAARSVVPPAPTDPERNK